MYRYSIYTLFLLLLVANSASSQTAEEVIQQIRTKLEKVNDYEAKGRMKTNVTFIKIPIANVTVYFKRPDKLRIKNDKGMSFVPKGTVNLNLGSLFTTGSNFDIIDVGKESGSNLRIIKMLNGCKSRKRCYLIRERYGIFR